MAKESKIVRRSQAAGKPSSSFFLLVTALGLWRALGKSLGRKGVEKENTGEKGTEPAVDTRRGIGQVTGAGKTFIILIADLRKETDTQGQVWG